MYLTWRLPSFYLSMFNDFVGVEVGYIDLGDYDAEGDTPSNRIDLDAEAFTLAIVGNWPVIDKMDLYAKAGIYSIDVESSSVVAGNVLNSTNDGEEEIVGTIGVEYDMGHVNLFTEFSVADQIQMSTNSRSILQPLVSNMSSNPINLTLNKNHHLLLLYTSTGSLKKPC